MFFLHCEHTPEIRQKYWITQCEFDTLFQVEDRSLTNFVYKVIMDIYELLRVLVPSFLVFIHVNGIKLLLLLYTPLISLATSMPGYELIFCLGDLR